MAYTVNGERFAGLNFRGFHPMKFFTGKTFVMLTLKQSHYTMLINKYSRENFRDALKNRENAKV